MPLSRRLLAAAAVWLGLSAGPLFAQAPSEPPPGTWTGTTGAGVSLTSGNSDTVNFNLAFDVTRGLGGRNVLKWTGLYLRGSQDDLVVVNRTLLGFRDEFGLSERAYLFGQIDYMRDTFKLIDYLIAPTAGLGYKVVDTDATKFAASAGLGSVTEKNPGVDAHSSAGLTAGEKLAVKISPTAELKHAVTGLWKADDFSDGFYTFSAGLATRISRQTQLSIDLLDTFKNRPPTAATRKNDIALVTAIAAKF